MRTVMIRRNEVPCVWGQSGAQGTSLKMGVFWPEKMTLVKRAAERLQGEDVVSVTKSQAYFSIRGNEPLRANGETPMRMLPRSMVIDVFRMTSLNCWGHASLGLLNHIVTRTWSWIPPTKQWVISLVSDKPGREDKINEFKRMLELLGEHWDDFASKPMLEIVAACPNVDIPMENILADNPYVLREVRKYFPDVPIGTNISPVAGFRGELHHFQAAQDAGADWVAICNAIPHGTAELPETIPWRKRSPLIARRLEAGAYSSIYCAPLIVRAVEKVAPRLEIPVAFGNGFYTKELIDMGFNAGGRIARIGGMIKNFRPLRLSGLIDHANGIG